MVQLKGITILYTYRESHQLSASLSQLDVQKLNQEWWVGGGGERWEGEKRVAVQTEKVLLQLIKETDLFSEGPAGPDICLER